MTCRPRRPATREHQSPGEAAYVNSIYPIDIGDMRCLRHALMVAAGVTSGNYAIKSLKPSALWRKNGVIVAMALRATRDEKGRRAR